MLKQKLQKLFKKSLQKRPIISVPFVLTNAITTQANLSGSRLKIT